MSVLAWKWALFRRCQNGCWMPVEPQVSTQIQPISPPETTKAAELNSAAFRFARAWRGCCLGLEFDRQLDLGLPLLRSHGDPHAVDHRPPYGSWAERSRGYGASAHLMGVDRSLAALFGTRSSALDNTAPPPPLGRLCRRDRSGPRARLPAALDGNIQPQPR